MTARLPILLAIAGAVLATVAVLGLRDMAGPWAVMLGLLACVGSGLVVAFLVGWPEVRVEEGDVEP